MQPITNRRLDALSRLKGITPVATKEQPLVRFEPMTAGIALAQPQADHVDIAEWIVHHRPLVQDQLLRFGALLFRGFDIRTPPDFERFTRATGAELFAENGEHPRGSLSEHVYTPVFYPPEKRLLWHNENSFNQHWPRLIWFCCAQPAQSGGETPLVDSRKVFERLDPTLRDEFVRKGVMYIRNYGQGLGLDWQTVFQTSDRQEVGARCRESGMTFEWKDQDRLKTRCVRPAVVRHPITGEISWFNQAQHFHTACLDPDTRRAITALFDSNDLPRSCCFGDGTEIPDAAMHSILSVYETLETSFPWIAGDVLMVDNVLAAHARNAFTGERKLLVAMGEMTAYQDLEPVTPEAAHERN